MVERERRYYGYTFQGTRGVTQGCLLSSHICNFVVDSIFLHCVRLVAENESDPEEFGYTVAEKADFFYADDEIVASANPVCLQWEFYVLINLFERVGLQTNLDKTVAIVCQSGPISGRQSADAYGRRMTGKGFFRCMKHLRRIVCEYCGANFAVASMASHIHT